MKVDFHTHSHFSDGALSPHDLVHKAADVGITHLSLTDHDTMAGLEQAHVAAKQLDITVINGVELSCHWEYQQLHVVGLNFDPNNQILKAGIEENQRRRKERAESIHQDLEKHGIHIRDSVSRQIGQYTVPTRPHFANALVEQGYAKDKKQAFKRYLVPGKPGFVPLYWHSVDKIANWIQSAGGVAVLAHPMRYGFSRTKMVRLIEYLLTINVKSIEVSTPITNTQQSNMLADLVRKYTLSASMGSDFHSDDQPWAKLGTARPLPDDLTPVWEQF